MAAARVVTRYLLDSNVVSALAPAAIAQHAALAGWLERHEPELYLPSVVIAELSAGLARLRRIGATRKAELLDLWMLNVLSTYSRRILSLDAAAAHETGLLLDMAQVLGLNPGFPDLAIAGIAKSRGMVLLTRNLRHFEPLGITARDPFTALPD